MAAQYPRSGKHRGAEAIDYDRPVAKGLTLLVDTSSLVYRALFSNPDSISHRRRHADQRRVRVP